MPESKSSENELSSIRRELLFRIGIQNLLLIAAVLLFFGMACCLVMKPQQLPLIAILHATISIALLAQWCHHGVRTMQIKKFILLTETARKDITWEEWLPKNRPRSWLGSRWAISTKGVFLGLQVMMLLPLTVEEPLTFWDHPYVIITLVILGVSTWLLLTNPKE